MLFFKLEYGSSPNQLSHCDVVAAISQADTLKHLCVDPTHAIANLKNNFDIEITR